MKVSDNRRIEVPDELKALLAQPRKVTIVAHFNPDADALGSSLAWARYLKKKDHEVKVIMPSVFPSFLDWMPGSEEVIAYSSENEITCKDILGNTDILFFMDFSSYERLKYLEPYVRNSPAQKMIIDHHQSPNMEADFWHWDVKASSTSELVYDLIERLGDTSSLDIEMGECLYAGIVTDTSSFKHPSTTKEVHLITADLIDLGVNTNRVQRLIYDNNSENRLRFIGYALAEKLVILPEYRTAYFVITQAELQKFNNQLGDTEGLVNYALSIENIVLAVILIEKVDCVKMSFRSTGDFAVNEFARSHFAGGGHKNAAGSDCMQDLKKTERLLLSLLPKYLEELQKVDK